MTAAQVREVVTRLVEGGHWHPGDPSIFDAGYDVTRLAYCSPTCQWQVLGRLRSDRPLHVPAPTRWPGTNGRPRRHGSAFALADPATWPQPPVITPTRIIRYGTALAQV